MSGLLAIATACATPPSSSAPQPVRLTLSIPFSGAWESIGRALAAEYAARLPEVRPDVVMGQSLESQVDALQAGQADLALEDAETAYLAYSSGTAAAPMARMRACGPSA